MSDTIWQKARVIKAEPAEAHLIGEVLWVTGAPIPHALIVGEKKRKLESTTVRQILPEETLKDRRFYLTSVETDTEHYICACCVELEPEFTKDPPRPRLYVDWPPPAPWETYT